MLTADYILKSTSIFTAADDTVRSGYIAIAKNQIVDVSETLNQNLVGESTEIMLVMIEWGVRTKSWTKERTNICTHRIRKRKHWNGMIKAYLLQRL